MACGLRVRGTSPSIRAPIAGPSALARYRPPSQASSQAHLAGPANDDLGRKNHDAWIRGAAALCADAGEGAEKNAHLLKVLEFLARLLYRGGVRVHFEVTFREPGTLPARRAFITPRVRPHPPSCV